MLTLETERLILRDFLLEDWEALNAILSDPQVTRFLHFASWDTESPLKEAVQGARSCGYTLNRPFWGQGYLYARSYASRFDLRIYDAPNLDYREMRSTEYSFCPRDAEMRNDL